MAQAIFGDSLDPDPVRVHVGLGIAPLPQKAPSDARGGDALPPPDWTPPDTICDRANEPGRGWQYPAGFVLGNQVFLSRANYRPDMFDGWPDSLPMAQSLLMTHELVHVWQSQNRTHTGYTTLRSGAETLRTDDPYFWADKGQSEFLAFNFEAQATIIEDYLCYTFLVPHHPKLEELADLIGPALPVVQNLGP
ncbi:hypothetical protein O2N63_05150 [Aliiroseovarius sp. KMU-50]|uniref:Type IV secretion protein Rhs n=1 Tax=Aliiroseovarius salicola TaxID=3009082 RepID=A0ABT4VZ35_9RHOB|nr:hypothetical protein [Aliiroseovarius sp. KMU-50]MDA5093471.1 hypothetical protein [Aliiroseovarius sp. KMU-50]